MKSRFWIFLLSSLFFSINLFAQVEREEDEDKDGKLKEYNEERLKLLQQTAGTKNLSSVNYRESIKFNSTSRAAGYTANNGNWGQVTINQQSSWGMGRVNCFAIDPNTPSTMYVGTPTGGLWKTNNSGNNWNNYTDALPVPGIAGICIDPNNTNIIYILTGTRSTDDNESVGVFKTTDGGVNWYTTGLDTTRQPQNGVVGWNAQKLLMDPNNSNVLFACMTNGLFRTQDGGQTWANVFPNSEILDMVFHPTNSNIIYITLWSGNQIFCSKDNGLTFSGAQIVPNVAGGSSIWATTLSVTPSSPDSVFMALTITKPSAENVIAIGRAKFNIASNSLSFGTSKQCFAGVNDLTCALRRKRDARLAVSPTTTANMYIAGLDVWSSNNYGNSWITKTQDNGLSARSPHTDCGIIQYVGTDVYTCDDGGIYKQPGTTNNPAVPWTILTGTMPIQQIYRIGVSQTSLSDFNLALQDNGCHIRTASTYSLLQQGDGVVARMDPNNSSLYYGSYVSGSSLAKYRNGVEKFLYPTSSYENQGSGYWELPFEVNQNDGKTLYTAYISFYKSIDTGNTWTRYNFGGVNETKLMAISKSNSNVIWLLEDKSFILRKSTNGGSVFNTVLLPVTIPDNLILNITISPFDENRVYLVMDGYTAGKKVFVTTDGGSTWQNISYDLPNVPIYTLAYEDAADNSIYIGTEIGVYYYNTSIAKWISFNNALPLCKITELIINYNSQKLIAATFGRGIFMTDLYSGSCPATVTLTGSSNQLNTYSASSVLNSTQTIYGGSNASIKYYSGVNIYMQPGFVAQQGSQFVAGIAGCGGAIDPILGKTKNDSTTHINKAVPMNKNKPTLPLKNKPNTIKGNLKKQ